MTKYCNKSTYGYDGFTDRKTVLDPEDDAAHVNWGGDWRMPTSAELKELSSSLNCTWTWCEVGNTEFNGVAGYKVQSKKSGYTDKWIFLPISGSRHKSSLGLIESGFCWSSTLNVDYPDFADTIHFNSELVVCDHEARYYGLAIRPVCP